MYDCQQKAKRNQPDSSQNLTSFFAVFFPLKAFLGGMHDTVSKSSF